MVPRAGLSAQLPANGWSDLIRLGTPAWFERREILFRQGEAGQYVYAILAGAVKVVRGEANGGQAVLTLRLPGDVVGDMAALDGQVRSASVIAITSVHARSIPADDFCAFIDRPSAAAGWSRYASLRLRESDEQRTELAVLPVRQRLARGLLRLEQLAGKLGGGFTVELPQHDLAQFVGASRNAVVIELTALRKAGVLVTRRGRVIVRDVAALVALADPPRG